MQALKWLRKHALIWEMANEERIVMDDSTY